MRILRMKMGSLELSINAIVIIIIAITMLGLGLTFMRSTFLGATKNFEAVSDEMRNDMITRLKDKTDRVALSAYELSMKRGEGKEIYLAIKNNLDSSDEVTFSIDVIQERCTSIDPANRLCRGIKAETFTEKNIRPGDVAVMKMIVTAQSTAEPDTYSIPIHITGGVEPSVMDETVDLYITVER
ncbi:hypothetical protein COT48_05455 [Candidatus Woesearchaeota archaeon CG08_land_8_20_14_0_20_47_9]|nr:MAG: hypothetical protein COT48_05455 [Candidatus Woesearchaeota archaeon CG08_land_8_20_14_0_20_47_9]